MISREHNESFVLTEQLHHSIVSGEMLTYWKYQEIKNSSFYPSLHYAISMHDYGWQNFDKQPFWNEQIQQPYSFIDFPLMAKLVIYQHGADEMEKENPYAASLCSHHYQNFLKDEKSAAAKKFVQFEAQRQNQIKKEFPDFDEALFLYHYGLLSLLDGISLFAAITEPGAAKENIHPFFKNGLEIPSALGLIDKRIAMRWLDEETIGLDPFPFEEPFNCTFKQKRLAKETIAQKGFLESYQNQEYDHFTIQFVPVEN